MEQRAEEKLQPKPKILTLKYWNLNTPQNSGKDVRSSVPSSSSLVNNAIASN